jgi:Ca-activated chloride channel family protein
LAGLDWLRFLDESGGDGRFVDGPGRVLATLPYRRALPANLDVETLLALVHDWVRANLRSAA